MKNYVTLLIAILSVLMLMFPTKVQASEIETTYVFIGDSRFCGMANGKGIGNTRTTAYGGNGTQVITKSGNIYWCAEVGTSINSFRGTADSILNGLDKDHTIIIYELGVNAPSNINSDINYCNNLVDNGWTVYFCDLLPINNYSAENNVIWANNQIYANEGKYKVIRFHDNVDVNRSDSLGYHYDYYTYNQWYDTIMENAIIEEPTEQYEEVFDYTNQIINMVNYLLMND